MTWHYIAGELSLLLGELQGVARDDLAVRRISELRNEVEAVPFSALAGVAAQSLTLADDMCRLSLAIGDSRSFIEQLVVCHELWSFSVSAGLVVED